MLFYTARRRDGWYLAADCRSTLNSQISTPSRGAAVSSFNGIHVNCDVMLAAAIKSSNALPLCYVTTEKK